MSERMVKRMAKSKSYGWHWDLLKQSINTVLANYKPERFTLLSISEEVKSEYNKVWTQHNFQPKQRNIMGALSQATAYCEEIKSHYRSVRNKKEHTDWKGDLIRKEVRHYVRTTQE